MWIWKHRKRLSWRKQQFKRTCPREVQLQKRRKANPLPGRASPEQVQMPNHRPGALQQRSEDPCQEQPPVWETPWQAPRRKKRRRSLPINKHAIIILFDYCYVYSNCWLHWYLISYHYNIRLERASFADNPKELQLEVKVVTWHGLAMPPTRP